MTRSKEHTIDPEVTRVASRLGISYWARDDEEPKPTQKGTVTAIQFRPGAAHSNVANSDNAVMIVQSLDGSVEDYRFEVEYGADTLITPDGRSKPLHYNYYMVVINHPKMLEVAKMIGPGTEIEWLGRMQWHDDGKGARTQYWRATELTVIGNPQPQHNITSVPSDSERDARLSVSP